MSFGFRVLNEDGRIAAGSDLANLFFSSKGLLSVGTSGVLEPTHSSDSVVFYKTPLPLVRRAGMLYLASMGSYNKGWWSGQATASGTIEYFVFSPPPAVNTEPFGINIYDENGNPTFNNSRAALKVVSVVNHSGDNYQSVGVTKVYIPFTVDVGLAGVPNLAFAMGGTRVYWTSAQLASGNNFFTDTYRTVRGMHLDSSNNLRTSTIQTGFTRYPGRQGNFNHSPNGSMPISMIVADMTGL